MEKNIFISYCWSNGKEADEIDLFFKSKGIELKRDKRELKYTKSIKEFMKTIRNTDYVLMIISDEYLKSFNCMYEVLEFIKDDDYKDRILPVIIDNAKIYGITAGVEYIKYWNKELLNLNSETEGLPQEDITHILENKKRLKKIQASIIEFISEVSDMKHYSYKEVKEAHYSQIFDYIGINEGTFQPKIVINDENLMSESYSEKYQMKKISGIVTFDYSNNNGIYTVGQNELLFELKWSKASNTSIHFYNDPPSIKEVALVKNVSEISKIANAQEYDVSSRARTASLNQIAIFRNVNGYYCAVKVINIKDDSRGDDRDELTFEYVIQTNGSPNFIENINKNESEGSSLIQGNHNTRERDIKALKEILMNFELNAFDYFFNNVPDRFNLNIMPYFDGLTEVVHSLNYHLYDSVLKEKVEKIHELQHKFTTYSRYYIDIGDFRFKLNPETPRDKVKELENICIEMYRNFSEFIKIIRKDWIEIDLDKIQCSIKDEIRDYEKRIEGNTSIYKNPYSENIKKLDNLFLKVKQTVDNYFNDILYYPELIDRIKKWRKEIVNINNCHQETGVSDFEKHQKIENLIAKVTSICDSLEITNFGKNKELINGQINNFLFERGQL